MSTVDGAESTATIVVQRAGWSLARGRDMFAAYVVTVNGRKAGKVRRGGTLTLPVAAGHHTVRAEIDWTGSPEVEVDVAAGERVELFVQPTGHAFRLDHMLGRSTYLSLEQTR